MKIVIAILILGGVIFFHELGHFLLAKASKVRVNEFALGMGPKILSFQKGETVYAWRLFPIGGSCSMQGEDEDDQTEGSFQSAKVWQRILIVAAGPVFNFILAFFIALIVIFNMGADPARVTAVNEGSNAQKAGLQEGDIITSFEGGGVSNARELYMYLTLDGMPTDEINLKVKRDGQMIDLSFAPDVTQRYVLGFSYSSEGETVEITDLTVGYPLEESGLVVGDVITTINGEDVSSPEKLQNYLSEHPFGESQIQVTYERNGQENTVSVVPKLTTDSSGGFSFNMAREKMGFFSSLGYGFGEIKYWINTTIKSLTSLFTGRFTVSDLSGPVGVVSAIGQVYEEAATDGIFILIMSMLNMVILLSANLGVMNLLPLPALDGGRLVFLIIECIRRKPCNQKIEGAVHFVGIIVLLGLAVFIAINDVLKLL